jgi:outer membrane lipoprotein-sorting protein
MEPRPLKRIVLALACLAWVAPPVMAAQAALTPEQIMQRNLLSNKVADSTTNSTFRLINASGQQRVRETEGETKLIGATTDNQRRVNFLSPADVRGTKTLLIEHSAADDDIWIYLPAMKKVRRLVSSNKKDSFVGTDFSYGDVIGHKVEEWNHRLLREEQVDGRQCYVIESTPRHPDVADNSGYSRRIGWIDTESFVAVRGEIYDLTGQLLKKTTAADVQRVDPANDRYQPMRLTAENVQTGHKTVIEFSHFRANVGVTDALFTPRALEN